MRKVLIGLIIVLNIFLRFYQLNERLVFTWDQISNSWVMKTMFVDKHLPLIGMVAKGNSGFYIGPAYYYLLAPFYWIFKLDPVAGGVFAGISSLLTLIAILFVTRKIFGVTTAIFSGLLYTVSERVISFDRLAWPVNLVPLASVLIFYFLYQILTGKPKFLIPLALTVGFAFHLHFTAIFFPLIILLCIPFFPRNAALLKFIFISIPIFVVWLLPNIVADLIGKSASGSHMLSYTNAYFHGLHLRRILQLSGDSLLELESFITVPVLRVLKFLLLPVFFLLLFKSYDRKKILPVCYLVSLWFVVPLIVLSTYKGELSDYYYSISRPIAPIIVGFLLYKLWEIPHVLVKSIVVAYCIFFAYTNIFAFISHRNVDIVKYRERAKKAIQVHETIFFSEGAPVPYLYGMYSYQETGEWR